MESGTRLGPYEILEQLGAGGMGEVYRGRDPRLDRDIAIKVLPSDFAQDQDRLARFEREAKMLASLNHANIAAIYGLEEANGTRFIVMELVQGETLDDRIVRKGALEIDEALELGLQIAEGLRAAHDSGVVHRDLKPANIQVTPEGTVKILDFGLAKAQEGAASSSAGRHDQTQSPTMLQATGAGMILGTAAYMSPEQAKGKAVDKRADIWAFGAVLYEMLTGEKLFAREDLSETLASVIRDEPPLDPVPRRVRRLLQSCLQKDPLRRLRDIGDVWALLDADTPAATEEGAVAPRLRTPWMIAAAAVVVAGVMTMLALPSWFREPDSSSPLRFTVPWPTDASSGDIYTSGVFSLSPDGRDLVILDNDQLWLRRSEALEPRVIEDTIGATYPFWSPDGDRIAFFQDGRLKKVSLATGVLREICEADGRGGSWGGDGTILFGTAAAGIYRVSDAGGAPAEVTSLPPGTAGGSVAHRYPQFLPGGDTFLYLDVTADEGAGVYLGALDGSDPMRVLEGQDTARFVPSAAGGTRGHLVFRRGATLMAQPFDTASGAVNAGAFPVAEGVSQAGNTGFASLSVGPGTLAYSEAMPPLRDLVWVGRSGDVLATVSEPTSMRDFDLSPDARRAAVGVTRDGRLGSEIWLYDFDAATFTPFAFEAELGWSNPLWSPDGRRIAYSTFDLMGLPEYEIRIKAADMSGDDIRVDTGSVLARIWDWTADGESILITRNWGEGDLLLRPLDDGSADEVIAGGEGTYSQAQFSPDDRWVAYTSTVSGQPEVYVRPYPRTGAVQQVSLGGGEMPRWRADGKELFYVSLDGNLMALPVQTTAGAGGGALLQPGSAHVLFGSLRTSSLNNEVASYAPAANGERFLVMRSVATPKQPITIVRDWQSGLQQ